MVVYSEAVSWLRPSTYTIVFIGFDFVSLLLQAAGGGIAASADTVHMDDIGKNIMVAGVSWQVVSLLLFTALCLDFARRVRKASALEMHPSFTSFRSSKKFKFFLYGLATATLTIFIRSVFRCAELSGGFHGKLANQEITFMILEGAMICVAVICLTVFHPGLIFGKSWHMAGWNIRKNSARTEKNAHDVFVQARSSLEGHVQESSAMLDSSKEGNAKIVTTV